MVTNFTISDTVVKLCGIPVQIGQKAPSLVSKEIIVIKDGGRDGSIQFTCVLLREEAVLVNVLNPLLQLGISLDLQVILVVEAQHPLHKPLTNEDKNNFISGLKRTLLPLCCDRSEKVILRRPFCSFVLQNSIFHYSTCFSCTRKTEISQSAECIGVELLLKYFN